MNDSNDPIDLDAIPQDLLGPFPLGVTEEEYTSEAAMDAFLYGLMYCDDVDVSHSKVFQRGGNYVVRVCGGRLRRLSSDSIHTQEGFDNVV